MIFTFVSPECHSVMGVMSVMEAKGFEGHSVSMGHGS